MLVLHLMGRHGDLHIAVLTIIGRILENHRETLGNVGRRLCSTRPFHRDCSRQEH